MNKEIYITISLIMLANCNAYANETRTIDFTASLPNIDGKPYTQCVISDQNDKKCLKSEVVTLGILAAALLNMPEKDASLVEQVKRGKLARYVLDAKAAELTAEQTKTIEDLLAKASLPTTVVEAAVEILDPAVAK